MNTDAIKELKDWAIQHYEEGEFEFNEWKLRVIDEDTYKTLGEIA